MRLRKRIKTTSAGSAIRVFSSDSAELQALDDLELFTEIENLVPPKPSKKNPPEKSPAARSMLTRRWTFCEQLIVRPCGIIVARAVFYDAEAASNVMVCPGIHMPTVVTNIPLAGVPIAHVSISLPAFRPVLHILRRQLPSPQDYTGQLGRQPPLSKHWIPCRRFPRCT